MSSQTLVIQWTGPASQEIATFTPNQTDGVDPKTWHEIKVEEFAAATAALAKATKARIRYYLRVSESLWLNLIFSYYFIYPESLRIPGGPILTNQNILPLPTSKAEMTLVRLLEGGGMSILADNLVLSMYFMPWFSHHFGQNMNTFLLSRLQLERPQDSGTWRVMELTQFIY